MLQVVSANVIINHIVVINMITVQTMSERVIEKPKQVLRPFKARVSF